MYGFDSYRWYISIPHAHSTVHPLNDEYPGGGACNGEAGTLPQLVAYLAPSLGGPKNQASVLSYLHVSMISFASSSIINGSFIHHPPYSSMLRKF